MPKDKDEKKPKDEDQRIADLEAKVARQDDALLVLTADYLERLEG